MPEHRNVLLFGSDLAERIVRKELSWSVNGVYDIQTLAEFKENGPKGGVFSQLLMVEPMKAAIPNHYRVCLQDEEILGFIRKNPTVDLLSFLTFIMTHEFLHIHRFTTGKADFYGDPRDEEVVVDALTRLFFTKNPVTGLKQVLTILDKVEAAPLYNEHIVNDQGRFVRAYL
ncbi:MAG TPA: hypothetical protein VMU10_04435 [Desulfomonilia bacterium]|nr:hypothetical protein [Desulfomonilia bacterium]